MLEDVDAKASPGWERVTQVRGARAGEAFGRVGMAMHERERNDLGLVGRQLLHSEGLDRRELAVDFDLRQLADGKIQVADFVGHQQQSLNNGR